MVTGNDISLPGFTSTSLDKDVALNYAIQPYPNCQKNSEDLHFPVLYEIFFTKNQGFIKIEEIDTEYPFENEILLQDGLTYTVLSKSLIQIADQNENVKDCFHIQLHFPKIKIPANTNLENIPGISK